MANFTQLETLVTDFFGVIGVLATEFVNLLTGDLLTMIFVGLLITLLIGIVLSLTKYIKTFFDSSMSSVKGTKMKK